MKRITQTLYLKYQMNDFISVIKKDPKVQLKKRYVR